MNQEERNRIIELFGRYQLTPTATILLDALIQTWEEALGNDDGLMNDLEKLAYDPEFSNYIYRRYRGNTRGVEFIHALQDIKLISRLAYHYSILSKIHLDRD